MAGAFASCSVSKPTNGHACQWKLCPYKGIQPQEWAQKVSEYTECQSGEDGYIIDMLHLHRPKWSCDKLHESMEND